MTVVLVDPQFSSGVQALRCLLRICSCTSVKLVPPQPIGLYPSTAAATSWDGFSCLRHCCSTVFPPLYSTRCCDAHCHSRTCPHHHPSARGIFHTPVRHALIHPRSRHFHTSGFPPHLSRARVQLSRRPPLQSGLLFPPSQRFSLPSRTVPSTNSKLSAHELHGSRAPRLSCGLFIAPLVVVRFTIPGLCRGTARGADCNRVTAPCPSDHSIGTWSIERRLWGRDEAVHDRFVGLVSCLDQLNLRVFCAGKLPQARSTLAKVRLRPSCFFTQTHSTSAIFYSTKCSRSLIDLNNVFRHGFKMSM